MGGNSSKDEFRRSTSSNQWNQYENQQAGYSQPYYAPPEDQFHHQQPYPQTPAPTSSSSYGGTGQTHEHKKRFEKMYSRIADEYKSLDEVFLFFSQEFHFL